MEGDIIIYLDKIIAKSSNKISEKFGFSRIDTINIFLTTQVLEKEYNLWFKSNNEYLSKFYEPIIFAVAVHFFENNYCEYKKTKTKIGDKYQKGTKRYEVIEVDCDMNGRKNATKLKCISRKDKNSLTTTASMDEYTRLNKTTQASNRDTFKPILKFVKTTLQIEENIPSFPYKFAIVAQKNDFENCFKVLDKKAFPYAYIADSGQKTENLPVNDSMFFVASSYETIQQYIFDKDIKLEIIVFIGNKYNHQIQQDIDREYFKQAIFIGEQKPDIDCLKWQWTLPEYQYLDDLPQGEIKVNKVENTELTQSTKQFIDCIEKLEKDYYIDLKRLFFYIGYAYPLVVLTDDSRLQDGIAILSHSFSKNAERILGEAFSNIGEDSTDAYNSLVDKYEVILKQFYFAHNAKTRALKQQKETDYLLVPKRQTIEVWQAEIKKLNWQKAKVISFSKLKTLSGQSTVTILSLQDYDFYCSIKDSRHTINWLLYDEEYQYYQKFIARYDNALIEEYKSKDRKKLTGIAYPDEIKTESTNDLVDRFWDSETDKERYTTTYQDHIDKEIIFSDGYKIELSANSTIILIDQQNKPRKYKVSDLIIGDKIRVYDNQHKEVLFDAISKNNENDKFNEILKYSKLWKKILTDYCVDNKTDKINEIATLCNIANSTVEGWLKNSNTKFPKNIKPLRNILGNDYQKIYSNNKKYNSIMIALGRNLSDEVSNYVIKKQKGQLLSQFDNNAIQAISNHNMPVRIIKKIEIIE